MGSYFIKSRKLWNYFFVHLQYYLRYREVQYLNLILETIFTIKSVTYLSEQQFQKKCQSFYSSYFRNLCQGRSDKIFSDQPTLEKYLPTPTTHLLFSILFLTAPEEWGAFEEKYIEVAKNYNIKGDAKKMIQTLLTVGAFRLKNSHFHLICQKIDTLSFLMSYCRYL